MNCEQVEARLRAYLDGMLVPEERRAVMVHLQTCPRCTALLAELRQNDLLLAHLPRVSPSSMLYQRIFSAPEVAEQMAPSNGAKSPAPFRPEDAHAHFHDFFYLQLSIFTVFSHKAVNS